MANTSGRVLGVNGNMVTVEFDSAISKNEVGYIQVGSDRLKGLTARRSDVAIRLIDNAPWYSTLAAKATRVATPA